MIQTSWLPEKIKFIEANPIPSADSPGIGVAYSHQRYILKVAQPHHPHLPATEWICHGLAFALGFAVPHWCVCILPDGVACFGSRMEGAVVPGQVLPGALQQYINPEAISKTYALDLFLGNTDRHPGNWLVTLTGGVRLLRPIDFSRALLTQWPMPIPPWQKGCNSHTYYQLCAYLNTIEKIDVLQTVDDIVMFPKHTWRKIIESVPPEWLSDTLKRELINWWLSPMWSTRLNWIKDQT